MNSPHLRFFAVLLPVILAITTVEARDYPQIILMLGDSEALGSPLASETRMEEVPLGTHMAEMWKQVPFTFAGPYSHTIGSGSGLSHIPLPPPDDPITEPRTWWQTLTRQPTADPQRSNWGAEIGLARDLYDRGYRNYRIVKYTYNEGELDDTFQAFMNDVLSFPSFDVPSFDHHPFEIAALVHFQKPSDTTESAFELYQKVRGMLPQTRHMKMFSIAHVSNTEAPPPLRPGFYRLETPAGFESQEQIENVAHIPSHDLSRLPTGNLSAQGLMALGQRIAHHMVLYRSLRPPQARSVLVHDPALQIVTEQFIDEQGRPKRQAEAYERIAYHYAFGRVIRMVFDDDQANAMNFTYSDENTLDQVRDPKTQKPLYLSAAGSYRGPNGLPMRLPMLRPESAVLNGVGRCASSPMSPWLWFNMTRAIRSENSNLTLEEALALELTDEDVSLPILLPDLLNFDTKLTLAISDKPTGPYPPARLMPDYMPAGLRGSFGKFHRFAFCGACCCSIVMHPLAINLPPIIFPNGEANFFDPTLACLPTPVGLRNTYEGSEDIPPLILPPNTVPAFLARKLLQQGVHCPSLVTTSLIPPSPVAADRVDPIRDAVPPMVVENPNQTGLFVPFPMETSQYLERLPKLQTKVRPQEKFHLQIAYEKIGSPRDTIGARRVPVEFEYSGNRHAPFASKSIEYDLAGRIVRETYLDVIGNPAPGPDMWSVRVHMYSADGMLLQTSYFDSNQRLCYSADGYSEVVHTYNTHRQPTSTEYFSPRGMPVTHLKLGYSAVEMTYRVGGVQLLSKRYFNTFNLLAKQKLGYAEIRFTYDDKMQRLDQLRFFDENGEPCAHIAGYGGINYAYAGGLLSSPKPVGETFVCVRGMPVMSSYGYAAMKHEYDRDGNLLSTSYIDTDTRPTTTLAGYGVRSLAYDRDGRLTSEIYTGQGAIRTPWGWARRDLSHDANGNLTEERYFDSDGSPVHVDSGYSRIMYQYDAKENLTGIAYMNNTGDLVLGPERFGMLRHRYRTESQIHDLLESTSFYGYRNDESISHSAGYTDIKYTHDSLNRRIREDFFGEDGRPGVIPVSFSSNTREYDTFGREILREYQSPSGRKHIGPEGAFSIGFGYDSLGRLIHRRTHASDDSLCPANSHVPVLTRTYRGDGVSFAEEYFAANDVPAISDRGIPGRVFSYEPDFRRGNPPSIFELYLSSECDVPNIDRYGRAGRSFELGDDGQIAREIQLNPRELPTSNILGYHSVSFSEHRGTFSDDRARAQVRTDGNESITLAPDGKLTYSSHSTEGFRSRSSGGESRLEYESPQDPRFHSFRHYACRGCGEQRPYAHANLILGPDRFARESVLYQKGVDLFPVPVAGFTHIHISYLDSYGDPVMNRWNFAKVIQEYDDLGQLVSESFRDTRGKPIITMQGFSKAEFTYENGYLTRKVFIAEASE